MEGDHLAELTSAFSQATTCVRAGGFASEIDWARTARLDRLDEQTFLAELAWCVLNAGMRESVIRRKWSEFATAFLEFASSRVICAAAETCTVRARRVFNHERKVAAIVQAARRIERRGGFLAFKAGLTTAPLAELRAFDYIGPVTVFHLARNLGVDCAKPDRHLVRLARSWGFDDVERFCRAIAERVGERIGVVDVVLWRHQASGCPCLVHLQPGRLAQRRTG